MSEWSDLDGYHPIAPMVGPFPHRPFLEAWWQHNAYGRLVVIAADGGAWAFVEDGDTVEVAGASTVTDYHSPLGDPTGVVAELLSASRRGTSVAFDSLPGEAAEPVAKAVEEAGRSAAVMDDGATMVTELDGRPLVDLLDAKQRHEVRRKERRFEELVGEATLERADDAFDQFAAMHREAPGDKGRFLTEPMEAMFRDLMGIPGARLDALVAHTGQPVAFGFGFEDDDGYYLYNSAFAPELARASPGIVFLHRLIDAVSASGKTRFDFLRGTEEYKKRLGARPRPLYRIEVGAW